MAVWGEVCAFELPFFLFWKSGFVFKGQVIWRTFLCGMYVFWLTLQAQC